MSDYNVLADTVFLSDTLEKHNVKIIDENVVIQDTIIITHKQEISKDKIIDETSYAMHFIVISLVVISLIRHYFKNRKNGKKL